MFRAILFDMDGVVIDTRQSITDFWQAVADEQNVTLTTDDFERHIHGVPAVATLRALFPGLSPEQDEKFRDRMTRYELGLRYEEVAGVTSLLRSLKAAGVKSALVTSGMGWMVEEISRQLALGRLFDVIVTAADIERGKPDPACYLAAAAKLRVAPAECVVFEDTVSGVRAAVAAGMACVGVQTGGLRPARRRRGLPRNPRLHCRTSRSAGRPATVTVSIRVHRLSCIGVQRVGTDDVKDVQTERSSYIAYGLRPGNSAGDLIPNRRRPAAMVGPM
jgi:beta-phosphoglucomutase-like phosphatase (HAD superfamily)